MSNKKTSIVKVDVTTCENKISNDYSYGTPLFIRHFDANLIWENLLESLEKFLKMVFENNGKKFDLFWNELEDQIDQYNYSDEKGKIYDLKNREDIEHNAFVDSLSRNQGVILTLIESVFPEKIQVDAIKSRVRCIMKDHIDSTAHVNFIEK